MRMTCILSNPRRHEATSGHSPSHHAFHSHGSTHVRTRSQFSWLTRCSCLIRGNESQCMRLWSTLTCQCYMMRAWSHQLRPLLSLILRMKTWRRTHCERGCGMRCCFTTPRPQVRCHHDIDQPAECLPACNLWAFYVQMMNAIIYAYIHSKSN